MKSLILLCLISLSISCGQIDTRPKYISATSTTLEAEMAIAPMNLQIKDNLKSAPKFFEVSGRSIPTSNGIHSVDEYQNIQINGDTLTFEVTEKLYVVLSSSGFYPGINKRIGAVGFSKMVTVEATQEPEGEIEVVFSEDSESFELKGEWFNGTIISLRYVYICTNKDLFYKSQFITVGSQGKKYGICKVSFEAIGDTILLGTKDNLLPFDGDKIYYEEACPETEFKDYAIITRYGAKWNTYFSWKSTSYSGNKGYLELYFPRISLGGNNLILENKLSTPYVDYIDDNIVKNNGTHFLIKYDKPRQGSLNTLVNVTFANSIDNEFVFPMNEDMILDTSTANTRAKAREILANDNSNEPDYIKLGRWVNKNMKYSMSYFGAKMTVDEILEKLIGVCEHFTRLYNALLQSIGIKAVYLGGYAISGKDGTPESADSVPHAWTMAKIDGKWKAFDSTWGLFFDKFPISHVFGNNYDFTYGASYSGVSEPYSSNDLTFVDYVDQPTLRNLTEEIKDALFIREENVTRKEVELASKEKELEQREENVQIKEENLKQEEISLNNTKKELSEKEEKLNIKETDLNNTEKELATKNEQLLNKERDLNNTELQLIEKEKNLKDQEANLTQKEEKLNEKEKDLNEKETYLNNKESYLLSKETQLNKKEETLNNRESELNLKEKNLNDQEANLNQKEEKLNKKEKDLTDREANLIPKEEKLNEKEKDLNDREANLNQKEEKLNLKEKNLNDQEANLIQKDEKLNKKEIDLNDREANLIQKDEKLNKKEKDLNDRDANLIQKDEKLNEKEKDLNKKENQLNKKEIQLNNEEEDLRALNDTLFDKELELNETEKNLNDEKLYLDVKNVTLQNKETKLDQRENYLNNMETDLNTKEKKLNEKETELNTKETNLTTKESDLNEKETSFNKKSDSNKIGLIIVCVLLGISIALIIFLFVRAKKSKDMLESSNNKNEKMTEMI